MKKLLLKTTPVIALLVLSGCVSQPLEKVDESVYATKKTYAKSTNYIGQTYQNFINEMDDLTNKILENKVTQFMIPDEVILKNRQNFVVWKEGNYKISNTHTILNQHIRNNETNKKVSSFALNDKIKILNEYYFQQAENEYLQSFYKKHPKPSYDEFLTKRENMQRFYEYDLALQKTKTQWEKELANTRKEVTIKTLLTLFGKPMIKDIEYDVEDEKLYFKIYSAQEKYEHQVYVNADVALGKKLKSNPNLIIPALYYYFNEDTHAFEIVGTSFSFHKTDYMASLNQDMYVKQEQIIFVDPDMTLAQAQRQYVNLLKNRVPPIWYTEDNIDFIDENNIVALGEGLSRDDAIANALVALNSKFGISVESITQIDKTSHNENFESSVSQSSKVEAKKRVIKEFKELRSETKDNIYYIAISHRKP